MELYNFKTILAIEYKIVTRIGLLPLVLGLCAFIILTALGCIFFFEPSPEEMKKYTKISATEKVEEKAEVKVVEKAEVKVVEKVE